MRGVGDEVPLGVEGGFQAGEQRIEGVAEGLELVVGAAQGSSGRGRGRRRSCPRWAAALAAMVLIGLLATACGGRSSPASATGGSTRVQPALAYARCMRAHGVPNFPDPDTTNGGIGERSGIGFRGPGVKPTPQLKSANQACQYLANSARG